MANQGPVFCIRVCGLQTQPLPADLLEDLKAWSWFTEDHANGDIVFVSTDQVVPATTDILKRLHAASVRHQYYRRVDLLQNNELAGLAIEEKADVLADAIPEAAQGDRFRLGIWNNEFQKLSEGLRQKINTEAEERDYCPPGIHFFMFRWAQSIRLTAIVIELTHKKHDYSVHFLPERGDA